MPKHLSLATVVEKNRVASVNAFVMLAEIDVVNPTSGVVTETLYLARNNENITYQGNTYTATFFEFDVEETSEGVPEVTVRIQDMSGSVMKRTEEHNGGVGWPVRFKYVNSGSLDQPPEIEELIYIMAAKAQDYSVEFTLGARNPLRQRFPRRLQWRDRCSWAFKSDECGYTGPETLCDYTLQGPDGCAAKNNTARFGGFPGIRPR